MQKVYSVVVFIPFFKISISVPPLFLRLLLLFCFVQILFQFEMSDTLFSLLCKIIAFS